MSTSQKEIEENNNLINKSNEIKDSVDKRLDCLLEKDNRSAKAEEKNDGEKINNVYMKSNSMVLKPSANINIIKANFNIVACSSRLAESHQLHLAVDNQFRMFLIESQSPGGTSVQ